MRIAIASLLCIHALIHLIGVVKEWQWANVPALSGNTTVRLPATASVPIGSLWLAATVALLAAATLLLQHSERWWIMAAIGVVLSQLLVLYAWPDAKTGTAVNVLLGIALIVGWAHGRFTTDSEQLARELIARAYKPQTEIVEASEIAALPAPVHAWLESAGTVGRPRATNARLKQQGGLRTSADGDFMAAHAEQYFDLLEPSFVWNVTVPMLRVPVLGRDSLAADGHGRMLIKALGLISMVDASGPEIDQGTLLRYLTELVWIPSAALAPYVRWQPLDDISARATMSRGALEVSADFYFNAHHQVERIRARRYLKQGDEPAHLEQWVIRMTRWSAFDGTTVPVEGEVAWELAAGDFTYYRWQIIDLQYNVQTPYGLSSSSSTADSSSTFTGLVR